MDIISMKKLSQSWRGGDKPIYRELSCSVNMGDKILLEGRSGSGKTTLLKSAAGLLAPTSGVISWGDYEDIYALTDRQRTLWRGKNIGYLNQDSTMLPNLTIGENIEYLMPGKRSLESKKRIIEILESLNIGHLQKSYPAQCSGGERQRAGVARALIKNPKLLLLDEPTASLDLESARLVLSLLDQALGRGAALLVSSHDPLVKDWASAHLRLADYQSSSVARSG